MLIVIGALAGLAGVALSAMAAHAPGGANLDTAARSSCTRRPCSLSRP